MPFDVATTLPKLDWIHFFAESASLLSVKIIKLEVLTCTGLGAFARWTFKECSHSVNDFRGCPESGNRNPESGNRNPESGTVGECPRLLFNNKYINK